MRWDFAVSLKLHRIVWIAIKYVICGKEVWKGRKRTEVISEAIRQRNIHFLSIILNLLFELGKKSFN